MARKAQARAKLPSLPLGSGEPQVVAAEKAQLQQRMDEARASIAETAGKITGNVEHAIDSVKSTVHRVLSIPERFQREPVAWSLGALSAGFALGYGLGRAHYAKTAKGRPARAASIADEVAAELATFCSTLVPLPVAGEIKSSLGIDLPAALDEIARTRPAPRRSRPKRPVRKKSSRKA